MIMHYKPLKKIGELEQVTKTVLDGLTVCIAPTKEDFDALVSAFKLDAGMLEDATDLYETPRIDSYQKTIYIYTRYCRPENKEIATEPITLVITPKQFIVLLREDSTFAKRLLRDKSLVQADKITSILLVLGLINDTYKNHLFKISKQVLTIRGKLNKHDIENKDFIAFIDVEEDLNEILGSLQMHRQVIGRILHGNLSGKLFKLNQDQADLAEDLELAVHELLILTDTRKVTVTSTREAYSTIMANNLNKTFKKLTSISIFMMIPTIISGIYGMNLALPFGGSRFAFIYITATIIMLIAAVILIFKRLKWL
jgi:magnesium transporter